MGVQCRCNGSIPIKDGTVRIRPSGHPYKRTTRQCRARKTLAKHPDQYSAPWRIPKCPQCGSRNWMVDTNRIKRLRSGKDICGCGGYSFDHRRGSKYCHYHPDAEQMQAERYE